MIIKKESLLAAAKIAGILGRAGSKVARRRGNEAAKPKPTPPKPAQPPKPPAKPKPLTTGERPKNIPKNWEKMPADKKEGTKYVDPNNRGNDIRIQKGNPNSQYPKQRSDYVRWKKNGQWLDKNGKPSTDPEKTHIPIEEFNFDLEIF